MKNVVGILVAAMVFFAQVAKAEQIGVGYQTTLPSYGLAATYAVDDLIDIQGVLGMWGTFNSYSVRGLYKFKSDGKKYDTYGWGAVGIFTYEGLSCNGFTCSNDTETAPGFGAGVGVRTNWQAYNPDLPPIYWNLDVGFANVSFSELNYSYSTIAIGGGLTYYLDTNDL